MCMIHIFVCYIDTYFQVSRSTEPTLVTSPGVLEPCQIFQLRFGYRKFENCKSLLLVCANVFLPWVCWDILGLLDLQKFLYAVSTTCDTSSMVEMQAFYSLHQLGISEIILLLWGNAWLLQHIVSSSLIFFSLFCNMTS